MKKINRAMSAMSAKMTCAFAEFKNSERGDTNFISMIIIIGIVVVLAGLFLTLGKDAMNEISKKVIDFIKNLG